MTAENLPRDRLRFTFDQIHVCAQDTFSSEFEFAWTHIATDEFDLGISLNSDFFEKSAVAASQIENRDFTPGVSRNQVDEDLISRESFVRLSG
jgi:hypothetical protein